MVCEGCLVRFHTQTSVLSDYKQIPKNDHKSSSDRAQLKHME